ncbi:50S ribosome-binding GTPase [Candidatus Woesearchaeota archaeon]|nr:50S ribosome-binding GTPase [Candidatus Woesearchaeota archaeon]
MNFQGLAKIEKHQWYIDLAFRNANKAAKELKSQKRAGPNVIKRADLAKVRMVNRTLKRHFDLILTSFPSIDSLPEFYQELLRATLDYAMLKKSLGAVSWASKKIDFFSESFDRKIRRCQEFKRMTSYSREYHGRIASVIKQISGALDYLEITRKVMKGYPSVKTKLFTVCIAGFPNVGKTTLLSKLTGSTPEIADYAFTTREINIGYERINNHKVQFIDTPGTLARFNKMNPIEKQAYLAVKYCADMIIFVFDAGDAGYGDDAQFKLLKSLESMGKNMVVYASKTDIAEQNVVSTIQAKLKKSGFEIIYKDPKDLKSNISKQISEQ